MLYKIPVDFMVKEMATTYEVYFLLWKKCLFCIKKTFSHSTFYFFIGYID